MKNQEKQGLKSKEIKKYSMKDHEGKIFNKSTILISIVISLLGVIGIIITPINTNFIVIIISVIILVVIFWEKFNQLDKNTKDINELNNKLDIEKRFNSLEKEVYEQKGRLSMVVKNDKKRFSR